VKNKVVEHGPFRTRGRASDALLLYLIAV